MTHRFLSRYTSAGKYLRAKNLLKNTNQDLLKIAQNNSGEADILDQVNRYYSVTAYQLVVAFDAYSQIWQDWNFAIKLANESKEADANFEEKCDELLKILNEKYMHNIQTVLVAIKTQPGYLSQVQAIALATQASAMQSAAQSAKSNSIVNWLNFFFK